MRFRRVDHRTVVILADDQETEIGRVVLPDGGVTSVEMERFIDHLKREAKRASEEPS